MENKKEKPKEEPSSSFQRHRVDLLFNELLRKFPIPPIAPTDPKSDEEKSTNVNKEGQNESTNNQEATDKTIKQEPPEKRMKM